MIQAEENYYELLQISRNADMETIQRVFRIMALRFHPDNTQTGDVEKFHALRGAYEVLSDPERRAQYDRDLGNTAPRPLPIFELKDFVIGVAGEMNRRLGILSLLYQSRRTNIDQSGVSLLDLEQQMSFPREYLCFTVWYLKSKGYIAVGENSNFELTAHGVDYVETNSAENNMIRRLLAAGSLSEMEPRAA
jgi:curved DNA-binding protein